MAKLKKYKNGGIFKQESGKNTLLLDALSAYGNTMMGMYGIDPAFNVDNNFLDSADDVTNQIMRSGAQIGASIAAPGIGGALVSGAQGAIGSAVNPSLAANQQPVQQQQQQLNIDPRFLKLAQGGPIVQENPQANGTDTMPIDAQGNPASVSGKKAIALTDSGEVIWNGYVFSDDSGYAKKAKKILNRYKLRLGKDFDRTDKLSSDQMNAELTELAQEQEKTRPQLEQVPMQGFQFGGLLPEDPPKSIYGGPVKFSDRRGQTYPQDIATRSQGFDIGLGQYNRLAPGYGVLSNEPITGQYNQSDMQKYGQQATPVASSTNTTARNINKTASALGGGYTGASTAFLGDYANLIEPTSQYIQPSSTEPFNPLKASTMAGLAAAGQIGSLSGNLDNSSSMVGGSSATSGVLDWAQDNPAAIGAGIQGLSLAARAANLALSPDRPIQSRTYTPDQISLARQRDEARKQRDLTSAQLRRTNRSSRAAQIAGATALDQSLSGIIGQSYLSEEQYNVAERNRAYQYNALARERADQSTLQSDAARTMAYDRLISGAGNIGAGYSRSYQASQHDKAMLDIMGDAYSNFTVDQKLEIALRKLDEVQKKNNKTI